MAITPADIKARFPEFLLIPDARIQVFIDDAVNELDINRWGRYYSVGIAYWVAHALTLALNTEDGDNVSSGMITSSQVGDTSVGYASPKVESNIDVYFQQTSYGLKFLTYIPLIGGGGNVAAGGWSQWPIV